MLRSRVLELAFLVWALAALAAPAGAQTSTATLSADIRALAKLTLSTNSVTFPDADPDVVPQVSPTGDPITITAKSRATRWGAGDSHGRRQRRPSLGRAGDRCVCNHLDDNGRRISARNSQQDDAGHRRAVDRFRHSQRDATVDVSQFVELCDGHLQPFAHLHPQLAMKPCRVLLVMCVCATALLCAVDAHAQKLDLSVSPQ